MAIRSSRPEKGLAYFELRDAFQAEGCPVCHLLIKRAQTVLDGLLYEQVTDPTSRDELRDAQGLCNWHAWMLPQIPSGQSGIAIIYQDLLRHRIESLRARPPRSFWRRLRRRFRRPSAPPAGTCPVCRLSGENDARHYLTTLLDFLADPAFAQAFETSFGLCLPHLDRALAWQRDHVNTARLLDLQLGKLADLEAELADFIRKFDYRFAAERIGPEGTSWRRAIELFVGKPGVFGNQRP